MQRNSPEAALHTQFARIRFWICATVDPTGNMSSMCHWSSRDNHGCAQWQWEQLDECYWWACPLSYRDTSLKCTKEMYLNWESFFEWTEPGQPFSLHDDVDNHAASRRPVWSWQHAAVHVWMSAAMHTVRSWVIAVSSGLYVIMHCPRLHTVRMKSPLSPFGLQCLSVATLLAWGCLENFVNKTG